ncbi:MAG: serine hydroxymethyltransferase [Spirochaetes bacterium]|nr:serine hydroxymethyltransferase [Spirochaetota bacterium]
MIYQRNIERIEELVRTQNEWRMSTINLIASENVMSKRARAVMGSDFCHRYAEGHPGERYYQGTEIIDEIEARVKQHLKSLFDCKHLDVRPISGTMANDAVFSRYIRPGDIVMVNSTSGGGHISHHRHGSVGKYSSNIVNFPLTPDGYHIDVKETINILQKVPVKVMIMGKSLYLFPDPVKELAPICRENGIVLIYDAAHVLGLIAGKRFHDPLREGAHVVNASTHKTFFGSQRGIIFSNMKDSDWQKIDKGAFPGSSSNHHLDTLVSLSITAFEFIVFGESYADQVIRNARALGKALEKRGFAVEAKEFGYTESHQVAVNVKELGGGDEVGRVLKDNNIILNMNLLPFDPLGKVSNPSGVRIGVQEMTRFGMNEKEMETIADLMKRCLLDGKYVGDDVKEFRKNYQVVWYSFDEDFLALPASGKLRSVRAEA